MQLTKPRKIRRECLTYAFRIEYCYSRGAKSRHREAHCHAMVVVSLYRGGAQSRNWLYGQAVRSLRHVYAEPTKLGRGGREPIGLLYADMAHIPNRGGAIRKRCDGRKGHHCI